MPGKLDRGHSAAVAMKVTLSMRPLPKQFSAAYLTPPPRIFLHHTVTEQGGDGLFFLPEWLACLAQMPPPTPGAEEARKRVDHFLCGVDFP